MNDLISVLTGERAPGLYRLATPISVDEVAARCQEHECQLIDLDGSAISNKAEFLQACAKAMQFPEYFGNNWDAFEDCFTDLLDASANPLIVLYAQPETFIETDPEQWKLAINILQSAVEYGENAGTSLYILFKTSGAYLTELKALE